MTDQHDIDVDELLDPVVAAAWSELLARLEVHLGPQDELAVRTAICKVGTAAFRAGARAMQSEAEQQLPEAAWEISDEIEDADPWADAYGAAGGSTAPPA